MNSAPSTCSHSDEMPPSSEAGSVVQESSSPSVEAAETFGPGPIPSPLPPIGVFISGSPACSSSGEMPSAFLFLMINAPSLSVTDWRSSCRLPRPQSTHKPYRSTPLTQTRTYFFTRPLPKRPAILLVPSAASPDGDSNSPIPIPIPIVDPAIPEDRGDQDDADGKPHQPQVAGIKTSPTLQLAIVFGLWYFQNVVFNIYNKKALNLFPYPWLLASFQLLVGSLWMAFLWLTRLQPFPRVGRKFFIALLGPALFHTVGHISACVSFSKAAVSFTHVIKASEPVFSVLFSALHGHFYPLHVWLSLLPIVFGCSLAALTEVSFNAQGLWGALISNVGFVLRNIYSKRSLYEFKHVNGLNLYGWISIISLLYLFPVAVLVEGKQWAHGFQRAVAMSPAPWSFYTWVLLSGVFYHLYNQSSYQALDKISPLTFSVGNTMKRVVVIGASLIVFRNPVRPLNALGSAIAVLGTFLYSQVTMVDKKKEKEKSS